MQHLNIVHSCDRWVYRRTEGHSIRILRLSAIQTCHGHWRLLYELLHRPDQRTNKQYTCLVYFLIFTLCPGKKRPHIFVISPTKLYKLYWRNLVHRFLN